MLTNAIEHLKAGRKAEARALLEGLLKEDPANEAAWLWYAASAENPRAAAAALETCLRFVPGSQRAREGLAKLRSRADARELDRPAAGGEPTAPAAAPPPEPAPLPDQPSPGMAQQPPFIDEDAPPPRSAVDEPQTGPHHPFTVAPQEHETPRMRRQRAQQSQELQAQRAVQSERAQQRQPDQARPVWPYIVLIVLGLLGIAAVVTGMVLALY